jgi:spermidine/putrescine transport system substrate-binding protein
VAQAGKDLGRLTDIANVKVAITDYQTLPEGKTWLHQSWSGDLLGGAFYYMPKGVPPSVLSYWSPDENGVVQNDFFCIGRASKNPALAHRFANFMLDEAVAYSNFVNFVGYTPPQKNIDAELLIERGLIPKSLTRAVVRPDQFPLNQELLQLSVAGEQYWDEAWSKFKAG